MKRNRIRGPWDFEHELTGGRQKLILGLDGGTTDTVCICMPITPFTPNHNPLEAPPVYARAVAGCSNHNSVGGIHSSLHLSRLFLIIYMDVY